MRWGSHRPPHSPSSLGATVRKQVFVGGFGRCVPGLFTSSGHGRSSDTPGRGAFGLGNKGAGRPPFRRGTGWFALWPTRGGRTRVRGPGRRGRSRRRSRPRGSSRRRSGGSLLTPRAKEEEGGRGFRLRQRSLCPERQVSPRAGEGAGCVEAAGRERRGAGRLPASPLPRLPAVPRGVGWTPGPVAVAPLFLWALVVSATTAAVAFAERPSRW